MRARPTLPGGFGLDTGSRAFLSHHLKRALTSGLFHGPRIVTSGKIICMTGGHGAGSGQEADGPDVVRRAAREQLKMGADWIKVAATAGLAGMPEKEDPRMVELTLRAGPTGIRG